MFEEINDFDIEIDRLLYKINKNCEYAEELELKIEELKKQVEFSPSNIQATSTYEVQEDEDFTIEFEEEILPYIEKYRKINLDNINELTHILPSEDDYHYNEILLRLCAESLKEIKNCEEIKIEAELKEDYEIDKIIECEQKKIEFIKKLLEPTAQYTENYGIQNKLILVPSSNGNISILKDIEHIPLEYYGEVTTLLKSIANNTFKNVRRFYNNVYINGFSEVKGKKIRIIFKRLNNDTYALITIFMKKTTADNGYRDFIKNKISNYISLANTIKNNLDNPEFLKLNEFYLQELWNKLGAQNVKGKEITK